MSSHGSDQLPSEKRAASPEVKTAAASVPHDAGKKAKEVYNVRFGHLKEHVCGLRGNPGC